MKKLLAIAACVMLSGSLLVSGTLAADLNRMASDIFADLSQWLGEALGVAQDGGNEVDVEIVTGKTVPQLYPGGTAQRACSVANRGAQPVYFRLACAVQYDAASWEYLKIDFNYNAAEYSVYPATGWQEITISGTPYRMKVFTYQKELPPDGEASPVTVRIGMDTSVTNEMLSGYRSDFLQMKALAVETAVFQANDEVTDDSAEGVLNLALPLGTNPF